MKGQADDSIHPPRIEKLQRQPRSGRIRVLLEDGRAWSLAEELVLEAGLHVDDRIDPAALDDLERRDEPYRAREAALTLLSYRARSTEELRRRLLRKGFSDVVVDRCTEEMREHGYLDDGAFAEAFVRDRLRLRPRGRRRLVAELRQKGVEQATADAAVQRVFADTEETEADLALEAARAWAARNAARLAAADADPASRVKLRRSLYGFLARRGFAPDTLRPALHAVLEDD